MAGKTPEEIAVRRIVEAARIGANTLDLSSLDLTSLPSEIGELTNLNTLDLYGNKLAALPKEIVKLTKLNTLSLTKNQFIEFPDHLLDLTSLEVVNLSANAIRELPSNLSQLINLNGLNLSRNKITSLPSSYYRLRMLKLLDLHDNFINNISAEIGNLTELVWLDLENNRLTSIPIAIRHLSKLKLLRLGNNDRFDNLTGLISREVKEIQFIGGQTNANFNHIQSVPEEICELRQLQGLFLSNLGLKHLPEKIGDLENLEVLDACNNSISSLPDSIKKLPRIERLDIHGNTDLAIPPEIGSYPATHLINFYFAHVKKILLNESKLIFIGQGGVGKTSLIEHIIHGDFNPAIIKTDGIAISKWSTVRQSESYSQQQKIQLNIWDFGGQEIMHATHQFFLTKRSLYLLVLDSRLTQEENRVEYWLKIIQSFGGESPVLIVGNKIDQHPLDIDRTGLQKKYPNIVGILETSAATGAGIEELKAAIAEQVNNLPHVRDLLPETWFTVKTKLEELGKQSNFITHDKYLDLCAENEVSDETSQRTLIGFLHDLGVLLHFQDDPRLEALGILNPQWVTNGVYKILNSHALFQNKGVLTVSMLDEILNLPEYPRGKRLFIVDMMKKFELCYDIPYGYDVESDKTFLVPDLLPKDEPAELKFNGVPAFEYAYPVLPSSVITRFIVRMNQKIDDGLVWRTGVVLKISENTTLVKADIEDRKITIAIDGVEHTRRDALSAIRFQLDEIHASIKGLNPEKRVPIPEAPNAEAIEYDYLLMLEREGQEVYLAKDGNRLVKVNIRQLLSGIESEAQRKESASRVTNIYIGGDVKDSNILAGDENEVMK